MKAADLRLVFAGTPDFAAAHLADLLRRNFSVVSAYSQPDRPSGRGKRLLPTPVKAMAAAHDIPVQQPLSFTPDAQAELAALQPDIMIVVAYGLLLPPAVLALPRYGCINVHASLLPRWRGAAPIERAILAGDSETGISIMQMDAGLDTGPVLATAQTPIHDNDNSESLALRLQAIGSQTLAQVLDQVVTGTARARPQQNDLACYAHKLHKHEAQIDWHCSARHIHNQVRAFYPRSPAWCLHKGQRLRLLETTTGPPTDVPPSGLQPGSLITVANGRLQVACEPGVLTVHKVQLEGRSPVTVAELHNGRPDYFQPGDVLESAGSHD